MPWVKLGWGVGDDACDLTPRVGPLPCSPLLALSGTSDEEGVEEPSHLIEVSVDTRPIVHDPGHLVVCAVILPIDYVLEGPSSVISKCEVVKLDEAKLSANGSLHPVLVGDETGESSRDLDVGVLEVAEVLAATAWVGSGQKLGVDPQAVEHIRMGSVVGELAKRSELRERRENVDENKCG